MRPKKRRRTSAAVADAPDVSAETGDAAEKKQTWKPVEMALETMRAFEGDGGILIEECDDAEVVYGADGLRELEEEDAQVEPGQAPDAAPERPEHSKAGKKAGKRKRAAGLREGPDSAEAPPRAPPTAPPTAPRPKAARSLNAEPSGQGPRGAAGPEAAAAELPAELPAWEPFGLHPVLLDGLRQLGFRKPTAVQAHCLTPAILQRKDIVGAAQTGSGKTLAFGLPILHHTLCAMDAAGEDPLARRRPPAGAATRQLRALVVLPTRELAVQVQGHLNAVSSRASIRTQCVVGGMSSQKQRRLLGRCPPIIVGTPGRLSDFLGLREDSREERCDWLRDSLAGLRHLVLDEADRLVESGHFKELHDILRLVYESLQRPQQLQTFVFSATLTLDPRTAHRRGKGGDREAKVDTLMRRMRFRDARAVHIADLTRPEKDTKGEGRGTDAEKSKSSASNLGARLPVELQFREMTCSSDMDREAFLVMWLLRRYRWGHMRAEQFHNERPGKPGGVSTEEGGHGTGGRVLLFVNAISSVLRLSSVLSMVLESPSAKRVLSRVQMAESKGDKGKPSVMVDVLGLHSRMRQKDRLLAIERFRELDCGVLVCTDIAARGLDLPGIAAVIHFHVPRAAEVFVHRSGRTARAGRAGESVSINTPGDATQWMRLYRAVGVENVQIKDVGPDGFELSAAREAARLATSLESKIHQTKKQSADKNWLRRTADAAELALSEDEKDPDRGRDVAPRFALWGLYRQMLERVRRLPKRQGGAPMRRRRRR